MHERVGIFVNHKAPRGKQEAAHHLHEQLPNSIPINMKFPLEVPDDITIAVVYGGDGSIKAVMEKLLDKDTPGILLTTDAGSQHGLHTALLGANSTIQVSEIQNGDLPPLRPFYPGNIHEELFVHLADLTKAGALQREHDEKLRDNGYIPPRLRAYAAFLKAFTEIETGDDYPQYGFDMLRISPTIGTRRVFPYQDLYADTLTRVSLQANTKLEGALKTNVLLLYLLMQKLPPETIAKIQTEKSFSIVATTETLNIDGEKSKVVLPPRGEIFHASRHHKSLPVAALYP